MAAETSLEGRHLFGQSKSSVSYPIDVFVSVTNNGGPVLRYLRFHVWFIRDHVFWDRELPDIAPWVDEGPDTLPAGLPVFTPRTKFERQVARLRSIGGVFPDAE